MAHEKLRGADAAWLHMESATNPMVVSGILELAAQLPLRKLHEVVERLATVPRFRARVVEPRLRVGAPAWEPVPDFDPKDHVVHVDLEGAGDASLRAFVARAVSARLDPTRPLWRVYLIDRPGAGSTILFRIHHAVGDGFALLDVLLLLCDGVGSEHGVRVPQGVVRRRDLRSATKALARLVCLPPDRKTALRAPLSSEKRVAWSAPIALARVKAIARARSASVNDVLVAVLAGAIRRQLGRRGETPSSLELHAFVPVNLRPANAPVQLDNQFGLVLLGLPIGVEDPLARVAAVTQRMKLLKASPEAAVAQGLLHAVGWAPRRLEQLAMSFFGKKASVVLTNVPGPRASLSMGGIPITRMMFWVPEAARIGLGISIFSYAGEITIAVLSDAAIMPEPATLVADIEAELASLQTRVELPQAALAQPPSS